MITTFEKLQEGDIFTTAITSSETQSLSSTLFFSFLFIKSKEEARYAIFCCGKCKFVPYDGHCTSSVHFPPNTEVIKLKIAD
ncbi:MAG: hypothetical protein WC435_03495 [Candidatus Paceibacterota bacterium]